MQLRNARKVGHWIRRNLLRASLGMFRISKAVATRLVWHAECKVRSKLQ